MKRLNIKLVMLVISIIFSIGSIELIIMMCQSYKQTEDTTKSYSATVKSVSIKGTGEDVSAEIYTEEYDTALYILSHISRNINMNEVRALKSGQRIVFSIQNIKADQMNEVSFIDLTSLKTESKDIFSLEDYNSYIKSTAFFPIIAGVAVAVFFWS